MSLLKEILAEASEVDKVSELVATLRNSRLPTIVVEEPSDVRIYSRWIERRLFDTYYVDILAAGGKANLLSLHERRSEFADLPVVFSANRGIWLFSGIPESYGGIVCTQGYSIENDVYSLSRVENLLDLTKAWEHLSVQESLMKWFAFELEKLMPQTLSEGDLSLEDLVLNDNFELEEFVAGLKLGDLVPKGNTELDKSFCEARGFRWPGAEITERIKEEYQFNLPGKLLFEMLDRFSTTPLQALYNTALVNYESKPRDLIVKIKKKLDEQRFTSSRGISSAPKIQDPVQSIQPAEDPSRKSTPAPKIQDPVPLIQPVEDSSRKSTLKVGFAEEADLFVKKLINDLRKNSLPTIIVVGKDNANLIEKLVKHYGVKEFLGVKEVKVMSIPKRDNLLSFYERRDEFVHILPVAFIADREMWSFTGTPEHYADIVLTRGYSLENDLYVDANLELLLEPHETWRHRQVLNSTIEWFAFEVEEFLRGKPVKMGFKLSEIVPEGELKLDKGFCQRRKFRQPSPKLVQHIKEKYQLLLPGNFLFQVLTRFLSSRGRDFNFNVTDHSLYDIALTMLDSQLQSTLYSLMQEIMGKLDNEEKRIAEIKPVVAQR